jgi:hypothetical protein
MHGPAARPTRKLAAIKAAHTKALRADDLLMSELKLRPPKEQTKKRGGLRRNPLDLPWRARDK